MRVLITGASGFIASTVIDYLLKNTDWEIVGIDNCKRGGLQERLTDNPLCKPPRFTYHIHDLRPDISPISIERIGHIDYIINFASETHVDSSIDRSRDFFENNIAIALTMFEYARKIKPKKFIQFSTDEVYGPRIGDHLHKEWEAIIPSNPYAASKAAQEAVAIAWWRTHDVPVIITNTMNLFGIKQDKRKFIPKAISKILKGEEVEIHCDETLTKIGSRFWLSNNDVADVMKWILENVEPKMFPESDRPERINVVGSQEIDNLEMAEKIAKYLDKPLKYKLACPRATRPGHDPFYGLDGAYLKELGYPGYPSGEEKFEQELKENIQWYLTHKDYLEAE